MSIEQTYSVVYSFLQTHQLLALAILVVSALFLWKKPAGFLKFTLFILGVVAIFYMLQLFGESTDNGPRYNKGVPHEKELEQIK